MFLLGRNEFMKNMKMVTSQNFDLSNIYKQQIDFTSLNFIKKNELNYRFYLVDEISEGNAQQYRLSMANVLSSISQNQSSMVYILSGSPQGIKLYVGVAKSDSNISEDSETLKYSFEGNFIGSKLIGIKNDDEQIKEL